MTIRIFKISTQEMWTFSSKEELRKFVVRNVLCIPSKNVTVKELIGYLPVEEYCRIE